MTRVDILAMAREAGWWTLPRILHIRLERFSALIAAAEREACANLRKEVELRGIPNIDYEEGFWDALAKYEDLIRARGTQ